MCCPAAALAMARDDRGDAVRVVPGLLAVHTCSYLHAFANRHACFPCSRVWNRALIASTA